MRRTASTARCPACRPAPTLTVVEGQQHRGLQRHEDQLVALVVRRLDVDGAIGELRRGKGGVGGQKCCVCGSWAVCMEPSPVPPAWRARSRGRPSRIASGMQSAQIPPAHKDAAMRPCVRQPGAMHPLSHLPRQAARLGVEFVKVLRVLLQPRHHHVGQPHLQLLRTTGKGRGRWMGRHMMQATRPAAVAACAIAQVGIHTRTHAPSMPKRPPGPYSPVTLKHQTTHQNAHTQTLAHNRPPSGPLNQSHPALHPRSSDHHSITHLICGPEARGQHSDVHLHAP